MFQGGATVISSFLRGCQEDVAADKGGGGFGGQLVDRVVITIAPMFLQGYNVLATHTGDASAASGSGVKSCVAADSPAVVLPLASHAMWLRK